MPQLGNTMKLMFCFGQNLLLTLQNVFNFSNGALIETFFLWLGVPVDPIVAIFQNWNERKAKKSWQTGLIHVVRMKKHILHAITQSCLFHLIFTFTFLWSQACTVRGIIPGAAPVLSYELTWLTNMNEELGTEFLVKRTRTSKQAHNFHDSWADPCDQVERRRRPPTDQRSAHQHHSIAGRFESKWNIQFEWPFDRPFESLPSERGRGGSEANSLFWK